MPTMKFTGFRWCGTDCAYGIEIRKTRREKHVGSRLFKGLKAIDRPIQARVGIHQIMRSRSQNKGEASCTDRLHGGSDSFYSEAEVVKRAILIAGCIFDCAPHQAGIGREPNGFGDDVRCIAESPLQISRYGQIRCVDNDACVRKRLISSPPSFRPRAQAEAALEVASASKPTPARMRAEATSQGFGITNMPGPSCSARKRAAFSFWVLPM